MASAGTLTIDVVAGIARLEQDFAKVSQGTDRLAQGMTRSFEQVNGSLGKVNEGLGQVASALNALGATGASAALEQVTSTIGNLATAIGSGPVGLIARLTAMGAVITAGIAVWRNWDASIAAVNASLSRTAQLRAGAQDTNQSNVDFEDFVRGQAGYEPGITTSPQAIEIINRFNAEQATIRGQLTAERNELQNLRSSWEQVREARAIDPNTSIPAGVLDRANQYTARLENIARLEGRLGQYAALRDEALARSLRGGAQFGPDAPAAAAAGGGGGGGGGRTPTRTADEQFFDRLRSLEDPMVVAQRRFTELDRLFSAGEITLNQYTAGLAEIGKQAGVTGGQVRQIEQPLTEMQLMLVNFSDEFSKAFVGAFLDADQDIGKALTSIARKILEFLTQMLIIKPLLQAAVQFLPSWAGGPAPVGAVGPTGPILIPGGQRATGGSVVPGVAYTVGEFGPERFIPSVPGSIAPGGGGDVTVVVNAPPGTSVARQEQRRSPFGGAEVEVWLEQAVNRGISSGRFDAAMGQSFGASRVGRV